MNNLNADVKKAIKTLLLLAVFVIVVFATNIFVDPANIASDSYAREAAEIVASGYNVTNLENFDDRDFLRCYAPLRSEETDVLVLGSSRSMQVTNALTGFENTFCAGVTGADLRDCIGAYMLFRNNGNIPEKVVFCAEYWFLSQGNMDKRALTEEYQQFCRLTGNTAFETSSVEKEKLMELFSFSYFQSSVEYILSTNKVPPLAAVESDDNRYPTRRKDGSYSYEETYRNRSIEIVEQDAYDATLYNSLVKNFTGADAQLQKQMEDFIKLMQDDGVEVVIQLAPIHPVFYTHMENNSGYSEILATEDYFYSLEDKLGIECYGSYNPEDFDMVSTDFYDAQHPTATGIYKYYMAERK